jgi:hypothetical protein
MGIGARPGKEWHSVRFRVAMIQRRSQGNRIWCFAGAFGALRGWARAGLSGRQASKPADTSPTTAPGLPRVILPSDVPEQTHLIEVTGDLPRVLTPWEPLPRSRGRRRSEPDTEQWIARPNRSTWNASSQNRTERI